MPHKRQSAAKKTIKTKVKKRLAKKKAVLSKRVKKIFNSPDESLGVVMFDHAKSNDFFDVPISLSSGNSVSINIVSHPLDQYSSPHLLNLSTRRYIERVKPVLDNNSNLSYQDLPAGEFLEKIHVFELLSLEESEILNFLKQSWLIAMRWLKKPFYKIDLSPKIPLAKKGHKINQLDLWQEISVINLVVFLASKVGNMFWVVGQVISYAYLNLLSRYTKRDEIVHFTSKEIPVAPPPKKVSLKEMPVKYKAEKKKLDFKRIFSAWSIDKMSLKPLLAFLAIALAIAIPIRSYFYLESAKETKGQVLGTAEEALTSLESAQTALSDFKLGEAEEYLAAANKNFVSAQDQLGEIKSFLTVLAGTIPLNNTFRSGTNLLDLGEKLTKAGEYLIAGLNEFSADSDFSLSSRIKNFKASSHEALVQITSAQENLDKINIKHLPQENQEKFLKLKENLPKFTESLKKSDEVMQFAINFLGDNGLKKYLIVFQNDNELRATGGFMGSLAVADFKNGNLEGVTMPAGGTYDLRAGFTKLLKAPEPLTLINPRWEFQDANWWPNWPTSAQNITYFYNKSDGATIDGVIAINSDWLGNLLDVIGSIEMPDYNKTISSANFEMELQKSIELEADDKTQPKKILSDLAPKLIENIFDVTPDKMLGLVSVFSQGLKEKDIQIYMTDENEQTFVAQNNWDGRMKNAQKDYLSVVATNIGGGKTDEVVNQEIYHQASISPDGSVVDSLVIHRSDFGPIDNIFTDTPNRSFIRVYVPLGSQLISAEGFKGPKDSEFTTPDEYLEEDERLLNEKLATIDPDSSTKIYTENNKTVFANWLTLKPGEDKDILLVYKLPFKIDLTKKEVEAKGILGKIKAVFYPKYSYDSYSLLVQKQAGSNNDKFFGQVEYPNGVSPNVSYPSKIENNNGESVYKDDLLQDLFYFIGLKN
ncbi:MAG: DUF4012 domain-containing protein [Candidatus Buchananbacteria bacterium]|nr:DUF4012 domain-containing protein [Candidatus Buchananbacteria bacterium]